MTDQTTARRNRPSVDTIAAHAGGIDAATAGVVPPITLATTYARGEDYAPLVPGAIYGRDDNPIFQRFESVMASLEGAAATLSFASGMAGVAAIFRGLLRPGDRLVVQRAIYWGAAAWIEEWCRTWGIERVEWDPETPIGSVLDRPTRLVWVETPSNPLWQVVDIAAVAAAAHAVGARLAVDGTTTTPILTRALEYGADLVFHSATKAIAGHSDVLLGVVATRVEDADWQAIRAERKQAGAIPGGFEVWLALRGLRTLPLRIRHTSATALALATWLAADPRVERVLYPGLTSHPGHAIAASQMQGGYGAMLSILTRGDALAVASRCRLFVRATSLGGPESLIEHRYTVEGVHTRSPASLLRLSIGLEAVDDLIADLDQALA